MYYTTDSAKKIVSEIKNAFRFVIAYRIIYDIIKKNKRRILL